MFNFFSNSLNFPFGMSNWFMPNWCIPNFYSMFQFPSINYFTNFSVFNNWKINTGWYDNMQRYIYPNYSLFGINGEEQRVKSVKSVKIYSSNKSSDKVRLSERVKYNDTRNNAGKIDNSYILLSQKQAEEKAKNDSNLELLKGGKNWSVLEKSFLTDIPYAKKGTGAILDKVANMIGEELIITSALGTGEAGNPHQKSGYASHHNAENPKLDIRTTGNGNKLAEKLRSTGYFSRVSVEKDHLDVQIDSSKYKDFEATA